MAYRVRGYPHLQTSRPQGTADELEAGKIDLVDVRPALLRGLEWVGGRLHRRLTIFSGYRTDAYSEQVGGFAGDPHTRGIADDVNIGSTPIGLVPRALRLLKQAGLVSGAQPGFYHGRPDPAHVQLSANATGAAAGGGGHHSAVTLERLWLEAGGPAKVARIMAAIALAESGGRVDAIHTNADGSVDRGLWQINSSHAQYDPARLLSDPLYNARAAVSIYHTQGLAAWTTYKSGAYRREMQRAPGAQVQGAGPGGGGRVRPGGGSSDPAAAAADAAGEAQLASWKSWLDNPATDPLWLEHQAFGWNPLSIFRDASSSISDLTTFLKWIGWMFHPRNILRLVEFSAGAGLLVLGLRASMDTFSGSSSSSSSAAPRVITRTIRTAARRTPAGVALEARRVERSAFRGERERLRLGKEAKSRERSRRRGQQRAQDRASGRKKPQGDIPF